MNTNGGNLLYYSICDLIVNISLNKVTKHSLVPCIHIVCTWRVLGVLCTENVSWIQSLLNLDIFKVARSAL